jgi:hypothetical protein
MSIYFEATKSIFSTASYNVHFSKELWFHPHRHAVKRKKTFLYLAALFYWYTTLGTALPSMISMPSSPLDNTHTVDSQVRLHGQ